MDIRVFNPLAASNASSLLTFCFHRHENTRKHVYARSIREVECASFTLLVMSASDSLAHGAAIFYQCMAYLLVSKCGSA